LICTAGNGTGPVFTASIKTGVALTGTTHVSAGCTGPPMNAHETVYLVPAQAPLPPMLPFVPTFGTSATENVVAGGEPLGANLTVIVRSPT
jgi:hypothetical protein